MVGHFVSLIITVLTMDNVNFNPQVKINVFANLDMPEFIAKCKLMNSNILLI
jgi:hypothetical protein